MYVIEIFDEVFPWLPFRHICKVANSDYFVMSACLAACLSAWNNSATTGQIFMKLDI